MPKITLFRTLLTLFTSSLLLACSGPSYLKLYKCNEALNTIRSVEICAIEKDFFCIVTPKDLLERKKAVDYYNENCKDA